MSEANQEIHVLAFVELKEEMNAEWQSHFFKDF